MYQSHIFTRYILREVVGYAVLSGVLFTFILFMRYLLPLLELAVRGIASPLDLLRLIGYLLPNFLLLLAFRWPCSSASCSASAASPPTAR